MHVWWAMGYTVTHYSYESSAEWNPCQSGTICIRTVTDGNSV